MPQFDVSSFTAQLFWLTIVFGFLYFLVSKIIAPKAESILTARHNIVESNIEKAEFYSEKIKLLEIRRADGLDEINIKAQEIYDDAMRVLDSHLHEKEAQLENIFAQKKQKLIAEIQEYAHSFHMEEGRHCVNVASVIIYKITNKEADLKLLKNIYDKL